MSSGSLRKESRPLYYLGEIILHLPDFLENRTVIILLIPAATQPHNDILVNMFSRNAAAYCPRVCFQTVDYASGWSAQRHPLCHVGTYNYYMHEFVLVSGLHNISNRAASIPSNHINPVYLIQACWHL